MIDTPLDNSNGSLKLTKRPGLGVEMNRDYLVANEVS
jgi:galactonate dehydratase